jgi:hypothetical protein
MVRGLIDGFRAILEVGTNFVPAFFNIQGLFQIALMLYTKFGPVDLRVDGLILAQGVPPEDFPDRYWVAQFPTATPSGRNFVPKLVQL